MGRETPLAGEEDLHIVRDDFIQFCPDNRKRKESYSIPNGFKHIDGSILF